MVLTGESEPGFAQGAPRFYYRESESGCGRDDQVSASTRQEKSH
jgi:hypothetical protein